MNSLITIIGLGPAGIEGMSLAAWEAIRAARRLVLRTSRHPAAVEMTARGVDFESLDALYESAPDFHLLYDRIAEWVIEASQQGEVSYAVPGHPLVAEESVRRLMDLANANGIPIEIIGSQSFIEPVLEALRLSITDGVQIADALSLDRLSPRTNTGLLLYQLYNCDVASAAKLALMKCYPDDFEVVVVQGEHSIHKLALHKMDRADFDHLTTVYIPPLPEDKRPKTFDDLVWVMARLRGEGGCPWDREQDHLTLKKYMIEECYEAIDAIDAGDMDSLVEELGDVLLQVVFHAQLETEAGVFTIEDVVARIVKKLIRRHPHVFGDLSVADSDEVLRNWEKIKKSEKEAGWRESALDGVPASLPALMRAMEISKRAVKVGFEWERLDDVLAKLDEEVRELREAIGQAAPAAIADEIGDLLFTIVNIARWQRVDPEDALRVMLRRFTVRFKHIEDAARKQGRRLEEMTLAEMDALWDEAKRH